MMKLSKTPFMALVSAFLLVNILITTMILRSAPPIKTDNTYQSALENYWQEKDSIKQSNILKSLYPEIKSDFPELVESHSFYTLNKKSNLLKGRQGLSELSLRIFSFYQYVKRKNWHTLTRLSYQTIQHYSSALDHYITEGKMDLKKVLKFNNEIKYIARSSKLRVSDRSNIIKKLNLINRQINRVEIYVGERALLDQGKTELNIELAKLHSFSKPTSALNLINNITSINFQTFKYLTAQYLVAAFLFFIMLGFYQTSKDKRWDAIYNDGNRPMALLNKNGQFKDANNALKELLPFTKFSMLNNLNWKSFERMANIDIKTPIKSINSTLITSGKFSANNKSEEYMIDLSPNNKIKGYILKLVPKSDIDQFQDISQLPIFIPLELREEVHIAHILEDVLTDLSILFQSKKVELNLTIKGQGHILSGNTDKTYSALKGFVRDMVLALTPKSKSKKIDLILENGLDGITLLAKIDDIKLATPILKSNFKFEEEGRTKKRNLGQGIEVLKNSSLGFNVDLEFGNKFDMENRFIGSNISIQMHN